MRREKIGELTPMTWSSESEESGVDGLRAVFKVLCMTMLVTGTSFILLRRGS